MMQLKKRVCPRWLNGKTCPFSAVKCFFEHTKDCMPLCQRWVDGLCIGGHGNSCSSRHYYMETDRNPNKQADAPTPAESVLTQFSSPLVQRNIKETKRLRRIHVDIETGFEKSFTEEIIEDIVDLTGQVTPVKPAALFCEKNLENIDPKNFAKAAESKNTFEEEENKENANQKESNDNNNPKVLKDGECRYCVKQFKGIIGLRSHIARNKVCGMKWNEDKRKSKVQNEETSNSSISSDENTTASSTMMTESSTMMTESSTMMTRSRRSALGSPSDTIGSYSSASSTTSVASSTTSVASSRRTTKQMLTSTPAASKVDNSKRKDGSCYPRSDISSTPTKDSDNIREDQSIIEIMDDSELNGSTITID